MGQLFHDAGGATTAETSTPSRRARLLPYRLRLSHLVQYSGDLPKGDAMKGGLTVFQGTLELLVLRTLAAESPLHGFEILDWIRRTTDEELLVEDGALYPALRRMEKRGWLRSDWAISEKGRRARYYELTAAGRKALEKEGARWQRYVKAVAKLGEA